MITKVEAKNGCVATTASKKRVITVTFTNVFNRSELRGRSGCPEPELSLLLVIHFQSVATPATVNVAIVTHR